MAEGLYRHYAVFGKPVLHSRSPQLYNALFLKEMMNACYTRVLVDSGRAVCEVIRMAGLSGANITTPFKETVVPYLDKLSREAEIVSAVNTIVNNNGELIGYNTDDKGVTGALAESGIDPSGRKCLVMGAGGAGKAAAAGLVNAGANVLITNRTPEKASEFAGKAGCRFINMAEAVKILRSVDVLVLALPPAVYPFDLKDIHEKMVIVDANYRSSSSSADIQKCMVIRGDRWLLHQATGAFRLFTGKQADVSVMEKGLMYTLDPGKLAVKTIRSSQYPMQINACEADLIVDGSDKDDQQIKKIINEEKNKAFRG
jgi:shikimate dehydrogenase